MSVCTTAFRNRTGALLLSAGMVVALAACGAPAGEATPGGDSNAAGDGYYPRTVTTLHGEVTIPEEPERIVALTATSADELIALGIEPVVVGEDPATLDQQWPWLTEQIGEISDTGLLVDYSRPQVEAIAAAEPDLILTPVYTVQDSAVFDQLNTIAPTVTPDSDSANPDWQDRLRTTAEAVNATEEAERLIQDQLDSFAAVGDAVTDIEDKTYQFVDFDGSTFRWGNGSVLSLFGLSPAANQDNTMNSDPLALENIAQLDADLLVILPRSEEARQQLESNPIFQDLPAVTADNVVFTDLTTANAMNTPGPAGLDWLRDQVSKEIEALD